MQTYKKGDIVYSSYGNPIDIVPLLIIERLDEYNYKVMAPRGVTRACHVCWLRDTMETARKDYKWSNSVHMESTRNEST